MFRLFSIFGLQVLLGTQFIVSHDFVSHDFKSQADSTTQKTACERIASPTLLELLEKLEIKHEGTLASMVEVTQKRLLRKPNTERWHISTTAQDALLSDILPFFKALDTVDEKKPSKHHYHYVLVFGSTFTSLRTRLAFLQEQWKGGLRFHEIVILSGERPLNSDEQNCLTALGYDGINDERDMLDIACKLELTDKDIQKVPLHFIKATAKRYAKRATTPDTVEAWLETKPKPDSILAVSCQPHVLYQEAVLTRLLPYGFTVEAIGPKAQTDLVLGVYTDTLARLLYECYKDSTTEEAELNSSARTILN